MVACGDSCDTGIVERWRWGQRHMRQLGLSDQSRCFVVWITLPVVTKLVFEVDFDGQPIPRFAGGQGKSPVAFGDGGNLECHVEPCRCVTDACRIADRLGPVVAQVQLDTAGIGPPQRILSEPPTATSGHGDLPPWHHHPGNGPFLLVDPERRVRLRIVETECRMFRFGGHPCQPQQRLRRIFAQVGPVDAYQRPGRRLFLVG